MSQALNQSDSIVQGTLHTSDQLLERDYPPPQIKNHVKHPSLICIIFQCSGINRG